jgi:hypothetical protein
MAKAKAKTEEMSNNFFIIICKLDQVTQWYLCTQ